MTGRRAILLVAAVGVALGIVGMHGVGLHSVVGADHGAMAIPASTSHDHPPSPDDHAPDDHAPIGLCIAVLTAAAGLLLLAFVLARRPTWLLRRLPSGRAWRMPRHLVPGTAPPPVWEFSVVRC